MPLIRVDALTWRTCALLLLLPMLVQAAEPEVILAGKWREGDDPGPYLVSEKLDGVRAIWDGHTLKTRSGNLIHEPAWFTAAFPEQPLDGELWIGRSQFTQVQGLIARNSTDDPRWKMVTYALFELPAHQGDFAERSREIVRLTDKAGVAWLKPVVQFRVKSADALRQRLDAVVAAGGEGLMLHRADAPYVHGRSNLLLKYKRFDDAEARVVAWIAGRGRLKGMVGAIEVERADGRRFRIGSGLSDKERQHPPPPGSWITYRYNGMTSSGLPRFPRFLRCYQPE